MRYPENGTTPTTPGNWVNVSHILEIKFLYSGGGFKMYYPIQIVIPPFTTDMKVQLPMSWNPTVTPTANLLLEVKANPRALAMMQLGKIQKGDNIITSQSSFEMNTSSVNLELQVISDK